MTQPVPLRDLANGRRLKDIAAVIGPLVMIGIVYGTLTERVSAAASDIRRLEQTALSVARIDTEIKYIKLGLERVEATEMARHEQLLKALRELQNELRYIRMQGAPEADVPQTIKGMMPPPTYDATPQSDARDVSPG